MKKANKKNAFISKSGTDMRQATISPASCLCRLRYWVKQLDFLDWIAASKELRFISRRDDVDVLKRLSRYRARGFIMDYFDAPIVARIRGNKVLLSRKSSFSGRSGIRCKVRILPTQCGCALHARLWHGPCYTAMSCIHYSFSVLLLLGSIGYLVSEPGFYESIMGFVICIGIGFIWLMIGRGSNAWNRYRMKANINELIDVLRTVANEEPERSTHESVDLPEARSNEG